MAIPGYRPGPGPQQPNKYPFVGPNYNRLGEQKGWIYNPYTDKYVPDPNVQKELANQAGVGEKKAPGLGEQLLPIAGVGLAIEGGRQLGKEGVGALMGLGDKPAPVGGIDINATTSGQTANLGAGGSAPTPGAATPGAVATQPSGLLGVGSTPSTSGGQTNLDGSMALPDGSTAAPQSLPPGAIPQADGTVTNSSGVSIGRWVQGAGGALQLYNAYNMYQNGDKGGAAITGAAGAGNLATAGGANLGAYTVPGLNIAAGLYGGYTTAKYLSDAPNGGKRTTMGAAQGAGAGAALGAGIGSIVPGIGTAIGGAVGGIVGGLAGAIGGWTGSDKDKYQMIRDSARTGWKEAGLIDENYQGTLADGSKFDFGKDGKGLAKLDYSDPTVSQATGYGNVLAAGEGAYGRATDGLSQLYTNAITSNAKGDIAAAKANALHLARQRGMTLENLSTQYKTMLDAGQINQAQHDAYLNGARDLFTGVPAATTPAAQTPGGQQLTQNPGNGTPPTASTGQLRSQTISPGIDKNGNRVPRGLLGVR